MRMTAVLARFTPYLIEEFPGLTGFGEPWELLRHLPDLLARMTAQIDRDAYRITNGVCIHRTATVEDGAVIKGPALIGPGAFVASHAYIRGNLCLGERCYVGPGSEAKSSIVLNRTRLAHFNYVGDSILGRDVNLEAGAVIANHFNERADKTIGLRIDGRTVRISADKFGALIGDGSRIGANAVLSPGTILPPNSVVGRLQLVDQQEGDGK